MSQIDQSPNNQQLDTLYELKIAYLVNVTTLSLSQSDHIKKLSLCLQFWLFFLLENFDIFKLIPSETITAVTEGAYSNCKTKYVSECCKQKNIYHKHIILKRYP